jgi:hypothetical protein
MGYKALNRLEVRMMYIGQGMANVVCGYCLHGSPPQERLSFLMVCDFGGGGEGPLGEIGRSTDELKDLMERRAKHEKILNQDLPYWNPSTTAYLDVFVLSHADADHYNLFEKLIRYTKCITKTVDTLVHKSRSKTKLFTIQSPRVSTGPFGDLPLEKTYGVYIENTVRGINITIDYEFQEQYTLTKGNLLCEILHTCCSKKSDKPLPVSQLLDQHTMSFVFYDGDDYVAFIKFHENEINISLKDGRSVVAQIYGQLNTYSVEIFAGGKKVGPFNFFATEYKAYYSELLKTLIAYLDPYFEAFLNICSSHITKLRFNMTIAEIVRILDTTDEPPPLENEEEADLIDGVINPFDENTIFFIKTFVYQGLLPSDPSRAIKFFMSKSMEEICANGSLQTLLNMPVPLEINVVGPKLESLDGLQVLGAAGDSANKRNMHSQTTIINWWTDPPPQHKFRFVFPGDPTAHTMYWMATTCIDSVSNAYVLSAPHHGSSRTAAGTWLGPGSDPFSVLGLYLGSIRPQYHIISSGKDNQFFHPKYNYVIKALSIPGPGHAVGYPRRIYMENSPDGELMGFADVDVGAIGSLYTTVIQIGMNSTDMNLVEKKVSYMFSLGSVVEFKYYIPNSLYPPQPPYPPHAPNSAIPLVPPRLGFLQFTHEHRGGSLWN